MRRVAALSRRGEPRLGCWSPELRRWAPAALVGTVVRHHSRQRPAEYGGARRGAASHEESALRLALAPTTSSGLPTLESPPWVRLLLDAGHDEARQSLVSSGRQGCKALRTRPALAPVQAGRACSREPGAPRAGCSVARQGTPVPRHGEGDGDPHQGRCPPTGTRPSVDRFRTPTGIVPRACEQLLSRGGTPHS